MNELEVLVRSYNDLSHGTEHQRMLIQYKNLRDTAMLTSKIMIASLRNSP